jgi:hypothetical protein
MATSPKYVTQLSRKCKGLDFSQLYGPPQTGVGDSFTLYNRKQDLAWSRYVVMQKGGFLLNDALSTADVRHL